jgi:hypothetical protein
MAMSLLAGGKQVPARQKPAQQPIAQPVIPPAKPLEIAAPTWLQTILDKMADSKEADQQYDDAALKAAIEKLRQEVGPIAQLKAELAKQKERADQLQSKVTDLMAQLVAARVQPKPTAQPAHPLATLDGFEVIRGADGYMRYLKLVKE